MVNDTSILAGIVIFFISCGVFLPYVNEAFGTFSDTPNYADLLKSTTRTASTNSTICVPVYFAGFYRTICSTSEENQEITGWDIIASVGKMFFWTFGQIPFFIDLIIFVPLRIVLGFLFYMAIRSGGG